MFIETHSDGNIILTFIKSTNVQAYPCGRRRSTEVDRDGDITNTPNDTYYFPFDPEARLNTEANNRKHSSLNGFTQTYLKGFEEIGSDRYLTIVLNGYLFKINANSIAAADFGAGVITAMIGHLTKGLSDDDKAVIEAQMGQKTEIYANILLEDVHLFSGFQDYYTSVLRNQSVSEQPETSLDLLTTEKATTGTSAAQIAATKEFGNYYFSGLSFSTTPLVAKAKDQGYTPVTRDSEIYTPEGATAKQQIVSLRILEKDGTNWKIHQPALLPKIEHGTTEDSIVVYGDTLLHKNLTIGNTDDKNSSLTLYGEATISKDLEVLGNITVTGTTEEAGNISAGRNIIAEQDITAKNNLYVDYDATVKKSLVVGERAGTDSEGITGTITAKTHVETPTLSASTSITTPLINVTKTDWTAQANLDNATVTKKLTVHNNTEDGALAELDNAIIYDTLTVTNNSKDAEIVTDTLEVTGTHTAKGNIDATVDLGDTNNIDAAKANITSLTGTTAVINNITGTNTVSSANMYQAGYKVPIIELVQSGTEYQLKISRIGAKQQN
jgi:hypothetical protein